MFIAEPIMPAELQQNMHFPEGLARQAQNGGKDHIFHRNFEHLTNNLQPIGVMKTGIVSTASQATI
jgi:hypothetical protein